MTTLANLKNGKQMAKKCRQQIFHPLNNRFGIRFMKSKNAQPTPPKHLRPETAAWWKQVVPEYDLESHHLRLLTKACEAWDRSDEAREAIAKHGSVLKTDLVRPARPEIAIERDSRLAFARLVRELGIDVAQPVESRPLSLRANR